VRLQCHWFKIQEVSRTPVGIEFLFLEFKSDTRWVFIALRTIIHGPDIAIYAWQRSGDRFAEIMSEGRNAAEAGQLVTQRGDPLRQG
jgi:hypothetical protein